ncbi:hypothetical protein FGB62_95g065 [Gracilaria domingensis]|nr:hypothetical protein FGB62_95g065 [Gracilaria domingensis]
MLDVADGPKIHLTAFLPVLVAHDHVDGGELLRRKGLHLSKIAVPSVLQAVVLRTGVVLLVAGFNDGERAAAVGELDAVLVAADEDHDLDLGGDAAGLVHVEVVEKRVIGKIKMIGYLVQVRKVVLLRYGPRPPHADAAVFGRVGVGQRHVDRVGRGLMANGLAVGVGLDDLGVVVQVGEVVRKHGALVREAPRGQAKVLRGGGVKHGGHVARKQHAEHEEGQGDAAQQRGQRHGAREQAEQRRVLLEVELGGGGGGGGVRHAGVGRRGGVAADVLVGEGGGGRQRALLNARRLPRAAGQRGARHGRGSGGGGHGDGGRRCRGGAEVTGGGRRRRRRGGWHRRAGERCAPREARAVGGARAVAAGARRAVNGARAPRSRRQQAARGARRAARRRARGAAGRSRAR